MTKTRSSWKLPFCKC